MDIEIMSVIDTDDVIEKINKMTWKVRLNFLVTFLNKIEWTTEAEDKEIPENEKKQLYWWLKRKIEWMDEKEGLK
ncbi:MAG TPA: hypothetical protein VMV43_05910 [Candidatus Nanopelagicaceae bacterium]|nr:hypothetical protein [Candidatus Nanopelagicaceae bacterium]